MCFAFTALSSSSLFFIVCVPVCTSAINVCVSFDFRLQKNLQQKLINFI